MVRGTKQWKVMLLVLGVFVLGNIALIFAPNFTVLLIATLIFVPSMPVKERLSYETQLSVLKKSITWISLATVTCIGSSAFVVYAYIAVYLENITNISGKSLSLALFLLGVASILGNFTGPMFIIIFVYGMLNGIGNNIQQYWITSAIPEAPDFGNGLFLAFCNLGTTIGTAIGGLLISQMGTQYIVLGGLLFLILSLVFILLRNYMYSPVK